MYEGRHGSTYSNERRPVSVSLAGLPTHLYSIAGTHGNSVTLMNMIQQGGPARSGSTWCVVFLASTWHDDGAMMDLLLEGSWSRYREGMQHQGLQPEA